MLNVCYQNCENGKQRKEFIGVWKRFASARSFSNVYFITLGLQTCKKLDKTAENHIMQMRADANAFKIKIRSLLSMLTNKKELNIFFVHKKLENSMLLDIKGMQSCRIFSYLRSA